MINIQKTRIILYTILFTFLVTGCASKEYNSFVNDYRTTYYKIADNIDITATYDSIERLQTEEVKESLEHMDSILTEIKDNVPSGAQEQYDNFCTYYEGLKFLKETYSKWDELTRDEQRRINIEMLWVKEMQRSESDDSFW